MARTTNEVGGVKREWGQRRSRCKFFLAIMTMGRSPRRRVAEVVMAPAGCVAFATRVRAGRSSVLTLIFATAIHAKLVDNFIHESDVTSLQDAFTTRS